ncbi:glycerophosphodiester phosphodiesterase family protein [Chitinophaga pendula]|uniref:glycerophosphodiester phosphodiesterase family protein n=1 Tax=Chitinophaga TaxID=79328 RepID=UPI000BAEB5E5|nr:MULTISPECIES: glycerophosphodiester phosphodiesterase family protein [Chitinophaga]ASZ14725.1 glycerophosphodiester phosphodiesterase [Chitinophaga sp. MD30]UCJ07616.1 glycerophosphodiester phosphodiesterase family protein [Chitinophaga pendula]
MQRNIFLLLSFLFSITFAKAQDNRLPAITKAFHDKSSKVIMIASHRGAHLEAPENSIAAFKKAIEIGIDIIELDVRCTKDGVPVVMHDKSVDRTTSGKGLVHNMTLAQIKQLRLKHNGTVTEEKVPTLEEALTLAKGKIMIDLDIKSTDCPEALINTVNKTGMVSQCLYFLSESDHLEYLKSYAPTSMVLFRTHSAKEAEQILRNTSIEAIHIDESHHNDTTIQFIKSKGARVWVNALGDIDKDAAGGNTAAFEEVLKHGANIIQTDQPALLKAYLISKDLYH